MNWRIGSLVLGFVLLTVGHGMGLFAAPAEAAMGQTGRILYVHVPTAWLAMVVYTVAFFAAVGALWTQRSGWDASVQAAVEVGVLLNGMLLVQGSIWARPTWGVWWTWDPRLTTAAVLMVLFSVVLLLRHVIEQPARRMTLTAIATIVAYADVPIVYFSVKWWRTLHQDFSSPQTVDETMVLPLRLAAFGMLFLSVGLVAIRQRTVRRRLASEADAPELPDRLEPLVLSGLTNKGGI